MTTSEQQERCGAKAWEVPGADPCTRTWIPCMKPPGHPERQHWSTSGCAGGEVSWVDDEAGGTPVTGPGRYVPGSEAQALRDAALATAPYPWRQAQERGAASDDCTVTTGGTYLGGCPDCGVRAGFDAGEAALIAAAPDLAFTVVEQAGRLRRHSDEANRVLARERAGTARVIAEQAEEIARLRESLAQEVEGRQSGELRMLRADRVAVRRLIDHPTARVSVSSDLVRAALRLPPPPEVAPASDTG